MNLRSTILIALMLAVGGALHSHANQQASGVTDEQYLALGQQLQTNTFGQTVWVKYQSDQDNTIGYASGVLLDATHVLTAGHVITENGLTWTPLQVGTGPNAFTNLGQTALVTSWVVHPTWNSTWSAGSLDAAILTLNSTNAIHRMNPFQSASVALDTLYYSSGFGRVRTPEGNELPFDGNIRGWTAGATRLGDATGFFSQDYIRLDSGRVPGYAPAALWHGDSGGGVYDSYGGVIGINTSYTGSDRTYALRWDSVASWVYDIITPVEPQIVSLTATNADVQLVWQGKGGSNYVVQASTALGGTNTFTDLSGVVTLPGAGPVLTNFLDAGALTNHPSRFYRIRLQ